MGRPSLVTFSTDENLKLWQCVEQPVERKEKRSFVVMLEMVSFDSAPTGQRIANHWVSKRFKDYVSSKFGADAYKKLDDKRNQILRQNKSQKREPEKQLIQQENQQIRQKKKQEAHEKEQEKQKRQEK